MEHTLAQLSNKQNLLEIKIKNLNDINKLLLEINVDTSYINTDSKNSIQDICKEIQECATRIKDAGGSVSNYAFFAGLELKKEKSSLLLYHTEEVK